MTAVPAGRNLESDPANPSFGAGWDTLQTRLAETLTVKLRALGYPPEACDYLVPMCIDAVREVFPHLERAHEVLAAVEVCAANPPTEPLTTQAGSLDRARWYVKTGAYDFARRALAAVQGEAQ